MMEREERLNEKEIEIGMFQYAAAPKSTVSIQSNYETAENEQHSLTKHQKW